MSALKGNDLVVNLEKQKENQTIAVLLLMLLFLLLFIFNKISNNSRLLGKRAVS